MSVGVGPEADLAITKTADPDPVEAGADLTYTLTVTNNGPNPAAGAGVEVIDDLPVRSRWSRRPRPGQLYTDRPGRLRSRNDALGRHCGDRDRRYGRREPARELDLEHGGRLVTRLRSRSVEQHGLGDRRGPAEADLAVTKTAAPNPVEAGADLTYTLTVTKTAQAPRPTPK